LSKAIIVVAKHLKINPIEIIRYRFLKSVKFSADIFNTSTEKSYKNTNDINIAKVIDIFIDKIEATNRCCCCFPLAEINLTNELSKKVRIRLKKEKKTKVNIYNPYSSFGSALITIKDDKKTTTDENALLLRTLYAI